MDKKDIGNIISAIRKEHGLPQVCTSGMSGFIGIIIANGIVSIYKGIKLLK